MKIFIRLFSLAFIVCHAGYAQTISTKITDQKNEALTGAVVELRLSTDSTLSKVAVADADGIVKFDQVKAGNYFLKSTFIGYNPYWGNGFEFSGNGNRELPTIKLNSSATNLQQATVTAFKPLVEVKSDKTVFNIENSINATGSTAYELLQKAPGVVIDNNDNILMKGRGGVMVQIDGRPTRMTETELADYLRSIQSTDVESIELINNPSSKYDAEGTAGIINIKLKKNKNYGTNGSVTAGYAVGTYSKYNTSLSLNNRSKKINIFSTYSNNWGERKNEFYLYREQNPYIYDQSSLTRRSGLSHNYKAGADYELNTKNTLGIMLNGNYSDAHGTQKNKNNIINFQTHQLDSILFSNQQFTSIGNNFNANLNHHYKDTSGTDITTDFDYGYYKGTRNTYQPNEYTLPDETTPLSSTYYKSYTPTTINIFTLKTDYSQNFLKGKLNAGYKVSYVNTNNTFKFYNIEGSIPTLDVNRSNQFEYTENVNAIYLNYQKTFGKLDAQAGLRMENTNSEGDLKSATAVDDKNVKRSYTDFFPSAGITFNADKNNVVGLVYSRRIDRPNYQELNPFEYKLDELSFRKGNPFLNPQYSDKIELSHTYKYIITTSIGYSNTKDFFAQIADTVAGGKSYLMPKNLATEKVLSANISASLQPVKWLSIYMNAGLFNQHYQADFGGTKTINTKITCFNFYAQNSFKLPWQMTFELSGWYNSGGVWGGSFKTKAQGSLDAGIQKRLLKDQATLKISYTDILHTAPWDSYNTYAGIVNRAHGNWESQQLRVALTWRFGNKQVKNIRQRSSGNEQEQKRIGGDN
jgi:hypothetical protein